MGPTSGFFEEFGGASFSLGLSWVEMHKGLGPCSLIMLTSCFFYYKILKAMYNSDPTHEVFAIGKPILGWYH